MNETAAGEYVWCDECKVRHYCTTDHGPDGHGGSSICCPVKSARYAIEFAARKPAESEQSIATQLAAALRSLVEPLGEVVVVNAGVMPTIVAPSMNGIIGPFNQARVALAAFDAVYGPQEAENE